MLLSNGAARRLLMGLLCLGAATLFSGCRHRQVAPTLPPVLKAPDVQPPTPDSPEMESSPPASISTAPPVKVTQTKPKRVPKKSAPKAPVPETTAPVETASAVPPAEGSPIGELSAGGESTPKTQQEAAGLIVSIESRLHDLPQTTAEHEQPQLRKVNYFLKQAKQALSTGDAEGAKTLATKAKLLMDDLPK